MKLPYRTPPERLREVLGEDGYEYLRSLHELIAGTDGMGQLGPQALGLNPTARALLMAAEDGSLRLEDATVEQLKAGASGVLSADADGNIAPGPLAPGASPRRVLRVTDTGQVYDDALDTEVPGASTLVETGDEPSDADPDTKVRTYHRNGYLVHKHTYTVQEERTGRDGTVTQLPVYKTKYKWLNLRDDQSRYVVSDKDPTGADEASPTQIGGANSSLVVTPGAVTSDQVEREVYS